MEDVWGKLKLFIHKQLLVLWKNLFLNIWVSSYSFSVSAEDLELSEQTSIFKLLKGDNLVWLQFNFAITNIR